jgi:uncharacterized repeat protein (TIGR03803 family)
LLAFVLWLGTLQAWANNPPGSTNLNLQSNAPGLTLQRSQCEFIPDGTNAAPRGISLNVPLTMAAAFGSSVSEQSLTSSPPSDLIVWWRFDEGSGTTVADASGNGHTATLQGDSPPAWINGVTSGALDFDGYQNYVESDDSFNETISAFTIEAWFAATSTSGENPAIISTLGDDIGFDYLADIVIFTNSPYYGNAIGLNTRWDVLVASQGLVDGKWHHVAGTWDGTNSSLYVDGELVATQPDAYNPFTWTTPLRLAYRDTNGGCNYGGSIGEVRIYSRALSSNEVAASYNSDSIGDGIPDWWRLKYFGSGTTTNSVSCASCDPNHDGYSNLQEYQNGTNPLLPIGLTVPPDLILWWRFDEGLGTFAGDVSGNGHSGVLLGDSPPVWTNGVTSGALSFDGSQNYVQSQQPFHETINAYTIEEWFAANSASGENPAILSTLGDDIGFDYLGDIVIWTNGTSYGNAIALNTRWDMLVANKGLVDGNWHHVAGTWDGTNSSLYVDGQLVASQPDAYDGFSWTTPLRLAYRDTNGGCNYGGSIGEVRIYSRALSSNEVAASYNTDTVGDGIPDWWRLQYFGSGTTTDDLSCASCDPTGDGFTNLQKFQNGLNPFVAYSITAPAMVVSYSEGNPASIPDLGSGANYSWSIDNGTLTSGDGTPNVTWTAGDTGVATLNVTMQTANPGSSSLPLSGNSSVIPCAPQPAINIPAVVYAGSVSNTASIPPPLTILTSFGGDTDGGDQPRAGLVAPPPGGIYYGATSDHLLYLNPSGTILGSDELSGVHGIGPGISATLGVYAVTNGGNVYLTLLGVTDGWSQWSDGGCYYGGCGTVFAVNFSVAAFAMHQFSGPDGALPEGPPMAASDGHFYGTTVYGGAYSNGVVYRVDPNSFTLLHSFNGGTDGAHPYGGLLQGTGPYAYYLYGTASSGGAYGQGTVFRVSRTDGTLINLHPFAGNPDGAAPMAGLIRGSDGYFYGTTKYGGSNGNGTVFKMSLSGTTFTNLHSFTGGTGGANPTTRLVQAADGFLYGVALSGANGSGTVFRISTTGSFSVVGPCPNENYLASELVQGTNAALLGTTTYGGDAGIDGCLYSISPINPATYTWSVINGSITSGNNTPAITWAAGHAGMATISLMITNPITHCTVTASTNILVFGNRIAAGGYHSLELQPDGSLWAWGGDDSGQLGENANTNVQFELFPIDIQNYFCNSVYISNLVTVAAGRDYGLAVEANGAIWSWGINSYGQLGNGSSISSQNIPSPITGLSNVVSVAAGNTHTLMLCSDGSVWAAGSDWDNELGVGGLPDHETNTPVRSLIPTGTVIVAIAAGGSHSFALDSSSNLWAWGYGGDGELGNGGTTNFDTPTKLTTISNVIAIAAGGGHSIALTADGRVRTWGDNGSGELGRTNLPASLPGLVTGALTNQRVVAIAGGNQFTLAATSNGYVYAWGLNNYWQLGTNNTGTITSPCRVPWISNALFVTASPVGDHSLAITRDQGTEHVWAWGKNHSGQLGDGIYGIQVDSPTGPVQFCDTCVQLGTSGSFTAHGTGTLTLFFNDESGEFYNNTGWYTVVISPLLSTSVVVWGSNSVGTVVGVVSNDVTYYYGATGYCARGPAQNCVQSGYANCSTDANGNDQTTHALVGCVGGGAGNACGTPCPIGICYSLVGKIALIPSN